MVESIKLTVASFASPVSIRVTLPDATSQVRAISVGVQGPPGTTNHSRLTNLDQDDHPQYLTEGRGDARYDPLGAAASVAATAAGDLADHVADADPHPQYLTSAEASAAYDPLGAAATAQTAAEATAASELLSHAGEANPHPVYLTQTEADALYDATGAAATAQTAAETTAQTALDAHTAALDPHPQYLTPTEGDAAYDASGAAADAIATHEGATDPHPQYLSQSEGDARYDAAGSASAAETAAADALAAHEAAANPHPVYLTQTEGDARYDLDGSADAAQAAAESTAATALAAHVAASDPHPGYTTAAELAAAIAGLSGGGSGSPGISVSADGVVVSTLSAGLDFDANHFALSVNSDGTVDVDVKTDLFDAAGAASAAVAAHEAASDPHPTYLKQAEGDALYDALGAAATAKTGAEATAAAALAAHVAASDPHPTYLTQTEGDARYDLAGAAAAIPLGIDIEQNASVVKYGARSLDFNASQFLITENSDGTIEVILLAATSSDGGTSTTIIFQTSATGFWQAADAAATGNVNVANPGTAIFDDVTLTAGQRLLLTAQTNTAENGVYDFNGSGAALTRCDDADTADEVVSGTLIFVTDGTLNGNKLFALRCTSPVTVGTTALTFESIVLPSNPEVVKELKANATLSVSDPNKWLQVNKTGECLITLPKNATAKIPVNSVTWGQLYGTGTVRFAAESGATVRSAQGLTLTKRYALFRIKKIGTNEFSVTFFGDLASSDFAAAGDGAAQVALHEAKSDPHPQYRPGIRITQDGVTVATLTEGLDFDSDYFALSVNSDGTVDVDVKQAASSGGGSATITQAIPFVIDGGGVAITTGSKGYIGPMPTAGTITKATLLADQSGSISIEVRKCTYANFDAGSTHPVTGDKISASAPMTLSSAVKSQDTTLTGWTTSFSAGDIIEFYVSSAATVQRVTAALEFTRAN